MGKSYTGPMVLAKMFNKQLNSTRILLCQVLCLLLGQECFAESAEPILSPNTLISSHLCSSPIQSPSSLQEDYSPYAGRVIQSIRHQSINVFDISDPKENNWLYSLFNGLHINTKSRVVYKQLLFREGDLLSVDIVAESERLLRSRSYLGDASIKVDQVCDDGVALLVTTRDIWTTEPEFKLSREGGENEVGFGVKEANIGGTGAIFKVGYYKDSNRSRVDYGFYSPHMFNTRVALDINFSETSDGQQSYFNIERPFYSVETPWAAGVIFSNNTVTETIRYADRELNAFKHQQEKREVFAGIALGGTDKKTQRVSLGFTHDLHDFQTTGSTESFIPNSYLYSYPWIEYRRLESTYAVYTNLNLLHQTEDVSLGKDARIRLGYAGSMFDNEQDVVPFQFEYSDLLGLGPHHLIKMSALVDGIYYPGGDGLDETLWGGKLGYYSLLGEKHRWYSAVSYFNGRDLPQYKELTLGGVTGLRGYPLDFQRGDQRYVVTVEKRYISDLHIFNLVRLGYVTYIDVGKAWGVGYPNAHQLIGAGVGLRFSSSKARVGTVLHIDLATPLINKDEVDSFQLILKGSRSL